MLRPRTRHWILLCTAGLLHAQAIAPLSFEVASLKPNRSGARSIRIHRQPGGGLSATNAPLRNLILHAYGLAPYQLLGGPAWLSFDRFDLEAKAPGASPELVRRMLQTLLAERCHLAVHRETRELPTYSLIMAKGGPKFLVSTADTTQIAPGGPREVVFEKVPIAMLTRYLAETLQRPVVDETGLTGEYDFKLTWSPDQAAEPPGVDSEPRPPAEAAGPSLFTALQEQLGLKLESRKAPAEIVVIDRIEKPTEN